MNTAVQPDPMEEWVESPVPENLEDSLEEGGQTHQGVVPEDKSGQRWDVFLTTCDLGLTRSRIQKLVEQGAAFLDHQVCSVGKTKVQVGQHWHIVLPDIQPFSLQPCPLDLNIVFEDDHILVLNKPWGLTVHPGAGTQEITLVQGILDYSLRQGYHLPTLGGQHKPGLVHRLDKNTSGLMIVAKTNQAFYHLTRQFANRHPDKRYWAFVWGQPCPSFGQWENLMGRDTRHRLKQAVVPLGGRWASTGYRTLASNGFISLLECRLHTGRTHQIRVHCAHAGHPIVGDELYRGGMNMLHQRDVSLKRQALHSYFLGLEHPYTGEIMTWTCPLADDLQPLAQRLGAMV